MEIEPLGLDPHGVPPPVQLSFSLDPAEEAAIASGIDTSKRVQETAPTDVRRLLIAAARSWNNDVVRYALHRLYNLCTDDDKLDMQNCGAAAPDITRIVTARMTSPHPEIHGYVHAWLRVLARNGIITADQHLLPILRVVKHHPDPKVRERAVRSPVYTDYVDNRLAREILLVALDDADPRIIGPALENIHVYASRQVFLQRSGTRLIEKVASLRAHTDPGIRGYAIIVTGLIFRAPWQRIQNSYGPDEPPSRPKEERLAAATAVRGMLDDKHPAVRAAASVALGEMMDFDAAPRLAALLDDRASTIYRGPGISYLTFRLSHPRDVRHSAAAALGHFAAAAGSDVCPRLRFTGETGGCLDAIRQWYEANRDRMPSFQ